MLQEKTGRPAPDGAQQKVLYQVGQVVQPTGEIPQDNEGQFNTLPGA